MIRLPWAANDWKKGTPINRRSITDGLSSFSSTKNLQNAPPLVPSKLSGKPNSGSLVNSKANMSKLSIYLTALVRPLEKMAIKLFLRTPFFSVSQMGHLWLARESCLRLSRHDLAQRLYDSAHRLDVFSNCRKSVLLGAILLLVWLCTRGTVGPNRFGEDPL